MKLIDSVSSRLNHGMTSMDHTIKKIANNPSASKKVMQLVSKFFAAYDLYSIGTIQTRPICDAMKGSTRLIDFYGSYKNLMSWVNVFSKDSLDTEALQKSIETSLCAAYPKDGVQKKLAQAVFTEVMSREVYYSKGEVLDAFRNSLIKNNYSQTKASQLAKCVIVKQKARPLVQLLSLTFFTIADLGDNLDSLKKWKILDLTHIAASIGSQSRIGVFIVNLGMDKILSVFTGVALTLSVGESTYQAISQGLKYYRTPNSAEKEAAYKAFRNAMLGVLSGGTDLVSTVAPMLATLNPATIVAMAIVSKGTGLICILIR